MNFREYISETYIKIGGRRYTKKQAAEKLADRGFDIPKIAKALDTTEDAIRKYIHNTVEKAEDDIGVMKSNNKAYGYYGNMGPDEEDAENNWKEASAEVSRYVRDTIKIPGWTNKHTRDFLDSAYGRHLAGYQKDDKYSISAALKKYYRSDDFISLKKESDRNSEED